MPESMVTFNAEAALGFITLNRPPANSFEISFIRELNAAIEAADCDKTVKAVVVKSASEKFFSAGADIKAFHANDVAANVDLIRVSHQTLDKMAASQKVFVAAINGHALGGGLEVALACDLRIAADTAKLTTAFARIGAVLDGGMSWSLTNKLGPARAMGMAMLADQAIDAQTAKDWGLVWDVVEDDALMDEAMKLARRLATGPTVALGLIKRQIALAQTGSMADTLRFEAACQGQAFKTDDFPEGVAAFQEKRKANFEGR